MLSRDNRFVKDALKLKVKKYRDQENKFIAEGIRFVEEAVDEGKVEYILYSSKLLETRGNDRILKRDVPIYEVDNHTLKEICDTENPQGVAAVVKKDIWSIGDIKKDFIVIVDGVQDPGNLGTIIRTADAAGLGGVVILKGTVDLYNAKTLRSTMGSIFHLPIIFYDDFNNLVEELKRIKYSVLGTSLDTQYFHYDYDFRSKTAIIIGNEANGVPQEHLDLCTKLVKIPMPGKAESLNAAIAAGVLIYEGLRQRLTT